jgi:acyl phosphate:glycerol-3-phosphate acyltransferase
MMDTLLVVIFSYISGSIPFGLILTKLFTNQDIRSIGSGNIGATNVLRTGNKTLAFITLMLDVTKGFVPVLITKKFFPEFIHLSCLLALLGHIFPIWLNFKGGKGVATYLGIIFALSYSLGFLFISTWLIVLLIFKYSSVSSIFSTMTVFVVTIVRETALPFISQLNPDLLKKENLQVELSFLMFVFLILIIFTHKKNISNLKNKTENKIKI